jgi:hypothetical protein
MRLTSLRFLEISVTHHCPTTKLLLLLLLLLLLQGLCHGRAAHRDRPQPALRGADRVPRCDQLYHTWLTKLLTLLLLLMLLLLMLLLLLLLPLLQGCEAQWD